jgi:hypothetical protein
MGTEEVSTARRGAGAYVQAQADRLRSRLVLAALGAMALVLLAFLALGGHPLLLVEIELLVLLALVVGGPALERTADRYARGAAGERKVGAILDQLGPGWHALHDVYLGRGNIDHILVGPAGTFTIETKANRGRIPLDRLDDAMLRQAYAERKLLEQISGLEVEALLVFSAAWLIGAPPVRRRGVVVLPARMLAGYLARRRPTLDAAEVEEIAARLRLALEDDLVARPA